MRESLSKRKQRESDIVFVYGIPASNPGAVTGLSPQLRAQLQAAIKITRKHKLDADLKRQQEKQINTEGLIIYHD